MLSITIVTHAGLRDGSSDDVALAAALIERGAKVRFAAWNDPSVDWASTSLTVIRSTWDYHLNPIAWFAWLTLVDTKTRLVNPAALIRWNSDKRYLLDLERAGVPIIPTVIVEHATDLPRLVRDNGWTDVVLKPAIGASAHGARRFRGAALDSEAVAHAEALASQGVSLLQPYQHGIEIERERSLVYVNGVYAHAFTKPGFYAGVGGDALKEHAPTQPELELGALAMASLPQHPTIARIDMISADQNLLLMEAELIEPQISLSTCRRTAHDLADALL